MDFHEERRDRQMPMNIPQKRGGGPSSFRTDSNRGGGDRQSFASANPQGSSKNRPAEGKESTTPRNNGSFFYDGPHGFREYEPVFPPGDHTSSSSGTWGGKGQAGGDPSLE
ncbi:galactose oxidase/kelch repeat superfamily protein [Striga asiatica]|uniref:Galactose oxidase/kelch repeat superfamily protein n=1 Tax=Striga asiatica TaxID=4170 RepID=A0A5A7QDB6_STRAF|nr:galactose oxidase/kelch repeat superfamily protein [Striga asiatica]